MKGNGRILVCVPSRGRAQVASEMLDSYYSKRSYENLTDIVIRVGEKDPTAHEYHALQGRAIIYYGTDDGFGWPTSSYCMAIEDIRKKFPGYSYYMMLEDDCVFETLNWDVWIDDQYKYHMPNRIGLIRLVDVSFQIHALVASAETIDVLGFFQCPELREQAFTGLLDLGNASGTMIEGHGCAIRHTPVAPGRGRPGYIYTWYGDTRSFWDEDCATLERWRKDTLPELAKRLKEARDEEANRLPPV